MRAEPFAAIEIAVGIFFGDDEWRIAQHPGGGPDFGLPSTRGNRVKARRFHERQHAAG